MERRIIKNLPEHPQLLGSFFRLARQVFQLPLDRWHRQGHWSHRYLPYALVQGEEVIANASVNRMEFLWEGRLRHYLQIGTVMTHPQYRGQGLARLLLEEILRDWRTRCDGIYLFANLSVLDFYPRFGFVPAREHQCSLPVVPRPGDFRPLRLEDPADRDLFRSCCQRSNPYARLAMVDNPGLLAFHCGFFLSDCLLYSPAWDALCVAQQEGASLLCYDILGSPSRLPSLERVLAAAAAPGTLRAELGFSPPTAAGGILRRLEDGEERLFVLEGRENPFSREKLLFPLLSHA